jgi:hypothetical protein
VDRSALGDGELLLEEEEVELLHPARATRPSARERGTSVRAMRGSLAGDD